MQPKSQETEFDLSKAVRMARHGLWLMPQEALPLLIDPGSPDDAAIVSLIFEGMMLVEVRVNGEPAGHARIGTEGSLLMELDSAAAIYARLRQIFETPGLVPAEVAERWTSEVARAAEYFEGTPVLAAIEGDASGLTPEMFGSDTVQPPAETQSYRNPEREETE